jgi:hypothetical protein
VSSEVTAFELSNSARVYSFLCAKVYRCHGEVGDGWTPKGLLLNDFNYETSFRWASIPFVRSKRLKREASANRLGPVRIRLLVAVDASGRPLALDAEPCCRYDYGLVWLVGFFIRTTRRWC